MPYCKKLIKKVSAEFNYRNIFLSILLSFAILMTIKIPTNLTTVLWEQLRIVDVIILIGIVILSSIMIGMIQVALDSSESIKRKCSDNIKLYFSSYLTILAFLLLFWMPIFLSFYPGNLSPDSYSSIHQALNHINSNAHPILYTVGVRVCLNIGLCFSKMIWHTKDMNMAIAAYSLIQMIIMANIFSYFIIWLRKHNAPKLLCIISVLYFAWNPLIARYMITMWKDIPFNGVLLLLVLVLYDIATEKDISVSKWTAFIVLSILAAFLRNRVIYLLIIAFVIILFMHKKYAKKLAPIFFIISITILLVQTYVYQMCGIKASNFSESQGVTLQQVACTVADGGIVTKEQKEFINQIIPLEDIPTAYTPGSVDSLKGYKTFDHNFLNTHKKEFMKVWGELFLKNIGSYTKAWLMNTRGYWGFNVWFEPFAITWESKELQIYQTNYILNWTGIDLTFFSNGILVHMGSVPIIRRFFDLGVLGWIVMFYCARQIGKKRYRMLLPVLPLVMIWITLIFTTPVFREVRYMFAFHLTLPFVIISLLMGEQLKKQE